MVETNQNIGFMVLATLKIGTKTYYVDDRLRQLRNVDNHDDMFGYSNVEWAFLLLGWDELREIVEKQQAKREKIFGRRT